ncbi:hypothetical protein ABG067_006904 [Albugo candida]
MARVTPRRITIAGFILLLSRQHSGTPTPAHSREYPSGMSLLCQETADAIEAALDIKFFEKTTKPYGNLFNLPTYEQLRKKYPMTDVNEELLEKLQQNFNAMHTGYCKDNHASRIKKELILTAWIDVEWVKVEIQRHKELGQGLALGPSS